MSMATSSTATDALDAAGLLASDLWIDRPDALDEIARRRRGGRLGGEEAQQLTQLCVEGYCVLRPTFPAGLFEQLDADVELLWREQPSDIAYSYHSLLTRFSGTDADKRRPSCRVADLHAFSEAARALYLDSTLFRFVESIFGEPTIATQSLYFEWGSQQALHRDPMHVQMKPPAHLLAAWVALEDIAPESGPLVYVPRSHRLPYYQFAPGRIVHDDGADGTEGILRAEAWDREHCAAAGIAAQPFLARRGEVLIWHHSLLHGGSIAADPQRTRKSFVIHYTTQSAMPEVASTYLDPHECDAAGQPIRRVLTTTRRLLGFPAVGFESPLHAVLVAEARGSIELGRGDTLRARIAAMEASRFWKLRNQWFAVKRALGLSRER